MDHPPITEREYTTALLDSPEDLRMAGEGMLLRPLPLGSERWLAVQVLGDAWRAWKPTLRRLLPRGKNHAVLLQAVQDAAYTRPLQRIPCKRLLIPARK